MGYTDRVVRAFRWEELAEGSEHLAGQLVSLKKWMLEGQVRTVNRKGLWKVGHLGRKEDVLAERDPGHFFRGPSGALVTGPKCWWTKSSVCEVRGMNQAWSQWAPSRKQTDCGGMMPDRHSEALLCLPCSWWQSLPSFLLCLFPIKTVLWCR